MPQAPGWQVMIGRRSVSRRRILQLKENLRGGIKSIQFASPSGVGSQSITRSMSDNCGLHGMTLPWLFHRPAKK